MSFPFIIWAINTMVYLASMVTVFIEKDLNNFIFMGPNPRFLNYVQAMNPYEVRYNYQYWRPLTSLFLTSGFYEYAIMTAYVLLFGFMLASTGMSFPRMLFFYLLSGYVGALFGAVCDSEGALFVGCNAACFAMFAAMISCLIVNWKALAAYPQLKPPLIFSLIMFTIMLMLNSSSNTNTLPYYHPHMVWGNWGGFINGLFLGLIMVPRARA